MEMEFNKDYQSGIKKPIFGIIIVSKDTGTSSA